MPKPRRGFRRIFAHAFAPALAVILLLDELARFLRTQNPWNCFMMTSDENYFAQVFINAANGMGFRRAEGVEAFHPYTTIGPPTGWVGELIHAVTGAPWAHAFRLGVHALFYTLLIWIGWMAYKRERKLASAVVALAIFSWIYVGFPQAGYTAYGILGETSGLLSTAFALQAFSKRKLALAAVFGVFAFFCKPSYVFLPPALLIAEAVIRPRQSWRFAAYLAVATLCCLGWIAFQRGEGILQYALMYVSESSKLAVDRYPKTIFQIYLGLSWKTWIFTVLMILYIVRAWIRAFRNRAELDQPDVQFRLAATAFTALGLLLYIVKASNPLPKHWLVVWSPTMLAFALDYAQPLGRWLERQVNPRSLGAALTAAIVVWISNVPITSSSQYRKKGPQECVFKEQEHINTFFKQSLEKGEIRRDEIQTVVESIEGIFLYELGFIPAESYAWDGLGLHSESGIIWGAGKRSGPNAYPPLSALKGRECVVHWQGPTYLVWKCSALPQKK
jgi:hypothetical protein